MTGEKELPATTVEIIVPKAEVFVIVDTDEQPAKTLKDTVPESPKRTTECAAKEEPKCKKRVFHTLSGTQKSDAMTQPKKAKKF